MGRRLGLFGILAGILLLSHPALAAEPDKARDWPGWAPSADEASDDSDGNGQTDALLDRSSWRFRARN